MSEVKTLQSLIKSAPFTDLSSLLNMLVVDSTGMIMRVNRQNHSAGVLTVSDSVVEDANECTHYGLMRTNTSTLNIPASSYGFLLNLRYDTVATLQIWLNWSAAEMYIRRRNSGGSNSGIWEAWKKFAFVGS